VAARKYVGLVQALETKGEAGLQQKLDAMLPGTKPSPRDLTTYANRGDSSARKPNESPEKPLFEPETTS
jgi:hypothetical protein